MTLGISTSFSDYALIIANKGKVLFNSSDNQFEEKKNIAQHFDIAMKQSGIQPKDITKIIVDIGPGGTTSVRTGVSFANSLAFSLEIPVCPVSSIELLSLTSWKLQELPVVSLVKFMKNNYFVGFYTGNQTHQIHYGELQDILPNLLQNLDTFVVTGKFKSKVEELFPNKTIFDLEILKGDVSLMIEEEERFTARALEFPRVSIPISEQNYANNQAYSKTE